MILEKALVCYLKVKNEKLRVMTEGDGALKRKSYGFAIRVVK